MSITAARMVAVADFVRQHGKGFQPLQAEAFDKRLRDMAAYLIGRFA